MKRWILRILVGVAGVLVVAAVVLALMGMRQDAGVSRASAEIQASREQLWAWISEPDKFKQWVAWVVDVQTVNPVKGVGHKDVVIMKEPGSAEQVRLETSWTEYAPPDRFAADVEFPGLFTGSQSYQLTDLGQGRTKVEITTRIHYSSALIRLLEPLATPSSTSKIETDLATLKRLAEADAKQSEGVTARGRILGIGGVFFKSANRDQLREWYSKHLGLKNQAMLPWRQHDDPQKEQVTVWSVFPASSNYFDPSRAPFMINYIVDDLDALLARLAKEGVKIDSKRMDESYGRFAWIYDSDGNKIELWQPIAAKPSATSSAR